MIKKCHLLILLTAFFSTISMAASVDDYQKRIRSARSGIETLLGNIAAEEAGESVTEPTNEIFDAIRELIPAHESIDTGQGSIETANQWFHEKLEAARAEADPAKRAVILSEINERLAGIGSKLEELKSSSADPRSKDEDKRKLAEILDREEYQKPAQQQESQASQWIRDFLKWMESWFPDLQTAPGTSNRFGAFASILQYVLIGLIILIAGFIIYKLARSFLPGLRRQGLEVDPDRVILGERIADDLSSADLFRDADRLAREGDLRGAIRKSYIALLCELHERKLIGLARHKTNRDYLRDVRSRKDIYRNMTNVTGSFERHWYGGQNAETSDWEEFRQHCCETVSVI